MVKARNDPAYLSKAPASASTAASIFRQVKSQPGVITSISVRWVGLVEVLTCPTAQTVPPGLAATLLRALLPEPAFGVLTTLQLVPFQRSAMVCSSEP